MPDAQAATANPSLTERSPLLPPASDAMPSHEGATVLNVAGRLRPSRRLRAVERDRQPPPDAGRARTTLPSNDFLKDVKRETRRAERSHTPLSLLVFRIDDTRLDDAFGADGLLELLHRTTRATDIIGLQQDRAVAVLCPDTDETGMQAFMDKVRTQCGSATLDVEAATYPDALFESLGTGTRPRPAAAPFIARDGTQRSNGTYAAKRLLDIVGASLALIFFAPLMLVVALVIATTSQGEVIFRQTRLGKGGVPFTFYKFRSMIPRADDAIHRAYVASLIKDAVPAGAAGSGAPYKLQHDPRVTWIGRLIRKTSIDELPQLFNVLKGEMSLVGPRPPIPYEAAQYQPWHLRRVLDLKPGITGLWQVEGRSRVTFNDMVRMDLRYCRECSLALDIRILLRTVLVVARCEGAV
jgi:lipopolysaccharide/colanic/teichoic acid biosynthesis glycosyltransferase